MSDYHLVNEVSVSWGELLELFILSNYYVTSSLIPNESFKFYVIGEEI